MKKMKLVCNSCGGDGYIVRDCMIIEEEEKTDEAEVGTLRRKKHMPGEEVSTQYLNKSEIWASMDLNKYEEIPVKVTGENAPRNIASFQTAGLNPLLVDNIRKSECTVPTPVQKYTIPIISAGRDLMVCAESSSGKTAAYLLPILHKLIGSQADFGVEVTTSAAQPQCVIITPTWDLAIQIHNKAMKFSQGSMIKSSVACIVTSVNYQAQLMSKGCNILISTPRRLIDLVNQLRVSFANLKFLVLDEVNGLLDKGCMHEIKKCIEHPSMPPVGTRNTLIFSDKFPDKIQSTTQDFLKDDYLFLTVGFVGGINCCSDVVQEFYMVNQCNKRQKLIWLLQDPGRDPTERTLIFVETCRQADFLATFLPGEGLPTNCIHGDDMLHFEREKALLDFRFGTVPIIVVSAFATRGLDMPPVKHIVNYDLPSDVDEYIQRIVWTCCNGKTTSFFNDEHDLDVAGPLVEMLIKNKIPVPDWLAESVLGSGGGGAAAVVGVGDHEDCGINSK